MAVKAVPSYCQFCYAVHHKLGG